MSDAHSGAVRSYPFPRSRLDPDQVHAQLRRDEPVSRVKLPHGPPAWLVASHQLVKNVLSDARFSRAATVGRDIPRYIPVEPGQVPESLLCMDPPRHTRMRRLVGQALTARRVERMRPRVLQIAAGLADGMIAAGPPADLVESFSFALPAIVITELTGVPEGDRLTFRDWTAATASGTEDQQRDAYVNLAGYLAGQYQQRREAPRDDLLTWLVQARDGEDQLTDTDLLFLGLALLVGGYETTARQISNLMYTLLTHPRQLDELRERPELLPGAVEELLRFVVFGNAVNPRIAIADVQVGDVLIREGEAVLCAIGSANRDESVFADPGELDLTRQPNPHVAFGHGPHFCLGAQLARLELQVSLETLLSRLPGLRIAVPADDLDWHPASPMSSPVSLPLTWDQRAAG